MTRLFCCMMWLLAAGVARGQNKNEEAWPLSNFDCTRTQALPLSRNAWGIIENLDPSSVTSRFDEGDLRTGIIPFVGVLAGSAVTPDGTRFLLTTVADVAGASTVLDVVVNWDKPHP